MMNFKMPLLKIPFLLSLVWNRPNLIIIYFTKIVRFGSKDNSMRVSLSVLYILTLTVILTACEKTKKSVINEYKIDIEYYRVII